MNISNLDPNQITRYGFDDTIMAHRMFIVNSPEKQAIESEIKLEKEIVYIDKPFLIKEIEYREIEKPIFMDRVQIERIEVHSSPVIIREKELEIVKIPEIVKDIQIVYVDKPFEITKVQVERIIQEKLPNWVWYLVGSQLVLNLVLAFRK